jgi:hypothetical protein
VKNITESHVKRAQNFHDFFTKAQQLTGYPSSPKSSSYFTSSFFSSSLPSSYYYGCYGKLRICGLYILAITSISADQFLAGVSTVISKIHDTIIMIGVYVKNSNNKAVSLS